MGVIVTCEPIRDDRCDDEDEDDGNDVRFEGDDPRGIELSRREATSSSREAVCVAAARICDLWRGSSDTMGEEATSSM
jgi:hypothetical protein